MTTIETFNSPALPEPQGFTHVSVATRTRTVFLAGQVAQDSDGELAGPGDLAAQTEQALVNVAGCVETVGASFADVAKTTMYVVDWEEAKLEQIVAGSMRRRAPRRGCTRTSDADPGSAPILRRVPDRDRQHGRAGLGPWGATAQRVFWIIDNGSSRRGNFTHDDLAALLDRLSVHEPQLRLAA